MPALQLSLRRQSYTLFIFSQRRVIDHLIVEERRGETTLAVLCGNWPIGKVVGLSYN